MRSVDDMRRDAEMYQRDVRWQLQNGYHPHAAQDILSRDVLDLLPLVEVSAKLAEACREFAPILEQEAMFATARGLRSVLAEYDAMKGDST